MRFLLGTQLLQPWERLPGLRLGLLGHLLDDGLDIAYDPDCHPAVAADLRGRRVDLDDAGIGGDHWRPCVADGVILLATQQHHDIRLAQQSGSPIETAFEEPEA